MISHPAIRLTAAAVVMAAATLQSASCATTAPVSAAGGVATPVDTGYYTYHYDNSRTGWNPTETKLSTAAVHSSRFGYVHYLAADGVVYAQPLYVPHLKTEFGTHNTVIIATENDSVYAYDADTGKIIWRRTAINAAKGVAAVTLDSVSGCSVITPTIGVSSTPVIDPKTNTLYAVDKVQIGSAPNITYHNRLHALNLYDGRDRVAPADIGGTITNEDGSQIAFKAQQHQNRPGLVYANGAIYVAFGSSCDRVPGSVHGWLFSYDARTLAQRAIFNTTATSSNTYLGAIWQSTYAPSVDASGNIYVATGNGTFDANAGHSSYAESILGLTPGLRVRDYFTPTTQKTLTINDQDVGSTGVMLVPDRDTPGHRLAITGEKDGLVFLLDRDRLGGDASHSRTLQTIPLEPMQNALYGGPAYYNGNVYWGATMQPMVAFKLDTVGTPHLTATSQTSNVFPGEGGEIPAVSSNGTKPGSAIVWATTRVMAGQAFQLFAYDALDLHKTLFSGAVGNWLSMGDAFLTPTIADGHVFVPGAGNGVAEFGLR